jgi:short-subunit dehydrogenase
MSQFPVCSPWGEQTFMMALHAELDPLGIHVTVVKPGYFRTDFLDATSLSVSPRIIATSRSRPHSPLEALGPEA